METSSLMNIIPYPSSIEAADGNFILSTSTRLVVEGEIPGAVGVGELFKRITGFAVPVAGSGEVVSSAIHVSLSLPNEDDNVPHFDSEVHEIFVTAGKITITAASRTGLHRATQTLLQLLREARTDAGDLTFIIPAFRLRDAPQFQWRGMLLDVCRHFFPVEVVKRTIDVLAALKMSVLHWHLTDDQGWRVQVRRYPELTDVGAWRMENGTRYGGFYTQDEVRDVVAYARARHITVVPEIEMPGHAMAALAAIPSLACTDGPFTVPSTWGVFNDVFCAGKEEVFTFLQNVLEEVLPLFDTPYVHIGGDECPKKAWQQCPLCQKRMRDLGLSTAEELQGYFISRMSQWLSDRGNIVVGWDEVLEGKIPRSVIVQSWRNVQQGLEAASRGHRVLSSPVQFTYLDQDLDVIPVEKIYSYEVVLRGLPANVASLFIGGEANMWTEWVPDVAALDRMVFPRIVAFAENMWTQRDKHDVADFMQRLPSFLTHLEKFYSIHSGPIRPFDYTAPVVPRIPGATVTTTLGTYIHYAAARAFDAAGDDSIFWSGRQCNQGEYLSVALAAPVQATAVTIVTGRRGGKDRVPDATVQVREARDVGAEWVTVGEIPADGVARVRWERPRALQEVRFVLNKNTENWVVVRDVTIEVA